MTGTGKQAILPVYMNKHHTLFPGGCSQDKGQAFRERIPRGLTRQGRKSTALTSGLSVIVIKSRCDSVTSTLCLCHALKKKKKTRDVAAVRPKWTLGQEEDKRFLLTGGFKFTACS